MEEQHRQGDEYDEDELANITKGMYEGLDSEDETGEPSRPTSAPPTLDISNGNLFAFAAFQTEDTFPIISDEDFGAISSSGAISPASASSATMSAFAPGVSSFKNGPTSNRGDPRKRTQSIEKFLAQSPGSILAPRKRYGMNATGAPRNNTGLRSAGSGMGFDNMDDPINFIGSESPSSSLRGVRKRLDALNLSNLSSSEDYLHHQNELDFGALSFLDTQQAAKGVLDAEVGGRSPVHDHDHSGPTSPVGSNAPSPTAPRSPLRSPTVESTVSFGSVVLGDSEGDPSNLGHGQSPSSMQQQQQQQQRPDTRDHSHLNIPAHLQPHLHAMHHGANQYEYSSRQYDSGYPSHSAGDQSYHRQQGMYMQDPYSMHQHMHQQQHMAPMFIQVQSGEMEGLMQQGFYTSQHVASGHIASSSIPGFPGNPGSAGSDPTQQYVHLGDPSMSGVQKVILPNGVEAMVMPILPPGMSWGGNTGGSGQVPPPPPPPTASSNITGQSSMDSQFHGRDSSLGLQMGMGMGSRNSHKPTRAQGMKANERIPPGPPGKQQKGGQKGKNDMHGGKMPSNSGIGPVGSGGSVPDQNTIISASAPLEDYQGSIFQLSQEQNGCRFLQQKVDRDGPVACHLILEEVKNRLVTLMMDPFGNYLFQKLLEHATPDQRQVMLDETRDHLVQAALNLHGTRSVQKFIEVCGGSSPTLDQLDVVIAQLRPYITKMSMDTNGNHVVQRCLQYIPRNRVGFVYDTVVQDVMIITRHRHGCCVFQRCIDAADPDQRTALINKVVQHAIELMQDPFGNYVVQYVLEQSQKREANRVISQLPGKLTELSMQKFSSNVVEKCLQHARSDELEPLIDELCESETMRKFLNDQYANYVVQRALQVADDKQGLRLVQAIRPHMNNLAASNASCARRVSGRVIKRFPSLLTDKLFSTYYQKDKF